MLQQRNAAMKLELERASAACEPGSSSCATVRAEASAHGGAAALADAPHAALASASAHAAPDAQQTQQSASTSTRRDDTTRSGSPSSDLAAAIATPLPPSTAPLPPPPPPPQPQASDLALHDRSRLFIVCGRGRKPDELRALFSTCGEIKNLHFALDRSNKSRGFAFLQYKDPACAVDAIARFHLQRMPDGHVLKVTIAKDKPVVAGGKLKRNQQQSSQETRDASDATAGDELQLPGKRQRSSPPTVSMPSAPFVAEMARAVRMLDTVDQFGLGLGAGPHPGRQGANALDSNGPVDAAVTNVMADMITALEQAASDRASAPALLTAYARVAASHASPTLLTEETTTEQLTSSIHSFTLDATPQRPLARHKLRRTAPPFTATTTTALRLMAPAPPQQPLRVGKASLLRRRRQSSDASDSSLDGASSDASASRRKRSNVSHREPSHWLNVAELSQRSRALDASGAAAAAVPKTSGKRQSSDHASARSAKQRVTTARAPAASASTAVTLPPQSSYVPPPESTRGALRTKLFFIASRKFTQQELDAMFAVYGDLESVETVTSFGRIKTMAYVQYTSPRTAAAVVESFQDENRLDADHVTGEVMKLSFAEDDRPSPSLHATRRLDASAYGASPMVQSPRPMTSYAPKLWLLLLYDRSVPSHVVSATASECTGMEFIDIKVFRSTGEAQGVAFVKFETETHARDAAHALQARGVVSDGAATSLQAIAIEDPSAFSATHSSAPAQPPPQIPPSWPSAADQRHARGDCSDDVDLSAVEAKFAHLMRSSDANHSFVSGRRLHAAIHESPAYADGLYPSHWPAHQQHLYPPPYLYSPQHAPLFDYAHVAAPHAAAFQCASYQNHEYARAPFGYAPAYYHTAASSSHALVGPPPPFAVAAYYPPPMQPSYLPPSIETAPDLAVSTPSAASGSAASGADDASGASPIETETLTPTTGGSSDSSDSAGATPSAAIYISSCRALDLVAVVKALDDCAGVVAVSRDGDGDDAVFVVDFADAALATKAVEHLDGRVCSGRKLRVATVSPRGARVRAAPSRRKRQRVDLRHRK